MKAKSSKTAVIEDAEKNPPSPTGSHQGNPQGRSVAAIVGLILGIIGLATSLIPIVNNMSFVFALIGIVFSIVGLVGTLRGKRAGKGLAIVATIVNALAIVLVLASQSAYSAAIDNAMVKTSDGSAASSTEMASGDNSSDDSNASASTSQGDEASGTQSVAADSSADKYTITDENLTTDAYSATIEGTFTNMSGKKLSYVGVSYNLFDASGNQIGNAYANTSNLADGASWKFDAYCTVQPDEIATYQLGDVTAY